MERLRKCMQEGVASYANSGAMPTPDGCPRIGFTSSIADDQEPETYPKALPYSLALRAAGGEPCALYNDMHRIADHLLTLDGILLCGGGDIHVQLYGGNPNAPNLSPPDIARDEFEHALILAAIKRNIPIFAICRGMQMLNVTLGGTLNEDIPNHRQTDYGLRRDERAPDHLVHVVENNSRIAQFVERESLTTNTLHHQSIRDVASGLRVVARTEDGVIEALEPLFPYPFLIAVQWHPEELREDLASRALFDVFIQATREYARVASA
jgi:putative glutamine amidotransferase